MVMLGQDLFFFTDLRDGAGKEFSEFTGGDQGFANGHQFAAAA